MAVMGMYCKAYPLERFREFSGWTERPGSLTVPDTPTAEGAPAEAGKEAEYLFLQENYVVTNGVFMDENVVFDAVTPEWEAFCRTVLEFEVPPYEVKEPAPAVPAGSNA